MDRQEFFKQAMEPDTLPDAMDFVIRAGHHDPERTFSQEGFEALGFQMHDFVMARTLAFGRREGRFPRGLRAEVRLVWDEERSDAELERDSLPPWWSLDDKGTRLVPLDGSHRLSTFLTDRRKESQHE